jgi:hypothetical protein
MNEQPRIEVVRIVRLPGDHRLKGFVDIRSGGLIIRNFRIIQQPGERIQILYPQTSYRDATGTIRYLALLSCPTEFKQRIDAEILSRWAEREINGATTCTANE